VIIATDTNILVYAHRRDSPMHTRARDALRRLVESDDTWAIPWPVVHEFLSCVTHPRRYAPPSTHAQAFAQLRSWLNYSNVITLGETARHVDVLDQLIANACVTGGAVHDARVAAICLENDVSQLWSADRDFSRFPLLKVVNPLIK